MKPAELAAALGRHVNTLRGYLERGLTVPADGETLDAWVIRASAWCDANRGKTGPKTGAAKGGELAQLELRLMRAKVAKAEMDRDERRAQLHSRKECEALAVRRIQEMSNAFGGLGDAMARRLYQQTPDAIKVIVDDEVRRRIAIIASGSTVDAGDAGGAASA